MSKGFISNFPSTVFALFCVSFFLSACVTKPTCLAPNVANKDIYPPATTSLTTDIFLDSTLSMQGFITDTGLSRFQQTIPLLERPIIDKGGTVNFFKFGTIIKPLPERSYREADKKPFYLDGSLNKKTLIQNVIAGADTSHLTIVVTDLYQEQSDIELLSKLINEKFIRNNYAVGVLAVMSEFRGTIFDVGTYNYSFKYPTGDEESGLRPYYLLAFGKHSDIARYFESLRNTEMAGFPVKNSVIFSRYLTAEHQNFYASEVTELMGLNDLSGSQSIVSNSTQDSNFKEFSIKKGSSPKHFSSKLLFQPMPDAIRYTELESSIKPCACQSSGGDSADNQVTGPDNNSPTALDIKATLDSTIVVPLVLCAHSHTVAVTTRLASRSVNFNTNPCNWQLQAAAACCSKAACGFSGKGNSSSLA